MINVGISQRIVTTKTAHIESFHENFKYSCDKCEYRTKFKGVLKPHIKSVHGSIFYYYDKCNVKLRI